MTDITVSNHGSIFLFQPNTDEGRTWLEENTEGQWYGTALVVDHRYAAGLAEAIADAGLSID